MTTRALVVLSGGQDSTTCLYWALKKYEEVHVITFDYGQRHRIELESAAIIAGMAGIDPYKFEVIKVPGLLHSTSPLTSESKLDKYSDFKTMSDEVGNKVEKTFVPMRNTLFLTIAFNRAVELNCDTVVTGICGEDNANYPDCTEIFRRRLEVAFNESLHGFRDGFKRIFIEAPLMFMDKAETVKLADSLPGCMKALAYSHTSYDGKYPPTDNNHSNILRANGFEKANIPDPLVLRAWTEGLMELPDQQNYLEPAVKQFMHRHGI
jgi:7-cyano-7-deazaguanine synthase